MKGAKLDEKVSDLYFSVWIIGIVVGCLWGIDMLFNNAHWTLTILKPWNL